jgi:hypothetical protein
MGMRPLLLRVMLGSLATAAAVGVLAVLFATDDVLVRVAFTAGATGIAAALMLAISQLLDRKAWQHAGLLGLGLLLVEYLMTLACIWGIDLLLSDDISWRIAVTTWWVFFCGAPAVVCVGVARKPLLRVAAMAGMGVAGLAFVCFMVGTWWPDPGGRSWRLYDQWLVMGWLLSGYGPGAVVCLVGVRRSPASWWRWVGVVSAVTGFITVSVWTWNPEWDELETLTVWTISLLGFITYTNLAVLCRLSPGQNWLRIGAIGAAALTAGCINALQFTVPHEPEFLIRLTIGASIVASCGLLATIILARVNRPLDLAPGVPLPDLITLICPRCQKKQTAPVGEACCSRCRLRIKTSLDESRCPTCSYIIYGYDSPNCPECGTSVSDG